MKTPNKLEAGEGTTDCESCDEVNHSDEEDNNIPDDEIYCVNCRLKGKISLTRNTLNAIYYIFLGIFIGVAISNIQCAMDKTDAISRRYNDTLIDEYYGSDYISKEVEYTKPSNIIQTTNYINRPKTATSDENRPYTKGQTIMRPFRQRSPELSDAEVKRRISNIP